MLTFSSILAVGQQRNNTSMFLLRWITPTIFPTQSVGDPTIQTDSTTMFENMPILESHGTWNYLSISKDIKGNQCVYKTECWSCMEIVADSKNRKLIIFRLGSLASATDPKLRNEIQNVRSKNEKSVARHSNLAQVGVGVFPECCTPKTHQDTRNTFHYWQHKLICVSL